MTFNLSTAAVCGSRVVLALILAATAPVLCRAQTTRALTLEGKPISVGMTRSEVETAISSCCRLTSDGDSTFVVSKEPTGRTARLLGAVFFRAGRVTRVRREVNATASPETAELALDLFRAAAAQTGSTRVAVSISALTEDIANGTNHNLVIEFPNGRTLTLSVLSPDDRDLGITTAVTEDQVR